MRKPLRKDIRATKVLKSGRITIPRDIREKLRITPGDYVRITIFDKFLTIAPVEIRERTILA